MSEQWIEMTVYNKLKIAILAIMTSQAVSAITIDPIQVQSGSGDLLYAEMKFSNANSNEKIEVGLADADDIQNIGISTQAPGHLNFYTRRSGDGTGVIVITSSRPIVESELNILLKVKEGSATHIQQVKAPLTRGRSNIPAPMSNALVKEKPLTPQIIVSEKDIALNLPTSTQYHVTTPEVLTPPAIATKATMTTDSAGTLAINVIAPPALKTEQKPTTVATNTPPAATTNTPNLRQSNHQSSAQNMPQTTAVTVQQAPQPPAEKAPVPSAKAQTPPAKLDEQKAESQKPKDSKAETKQAKPNESHVEKSKAESQKALKQEKANKALDKQPKHIVQANESLWKIASRIAAETNQSVPEVMRQIKANNANAFIQGDVNRIRRGAALNLAASYRQIPQSKNKVATAGPEIAKKQSGSAKYRLDQAEMSLVADNEQPAVQSQGKQNTQLNQTTTELSTKVMTSREKTVKLQKNVNQLAAGLQQKNQRIQLLNAQLAQLQQQLKQQNAKKPNS